jgi:ribonucleoside-diphosphate reductase alpha chain
VSSPPFRRIRKRDGRLVAFQAAEIVDAVVRAGREVGRGDHALAEEVTRRVVDDLAMRFDGRSPGVEDIQDAVEATLIGLGLPEVATAYILYRRRRAEARQAKQVLGVRDDLKLTVNAVTVLRERYLLRDAEGRVVESSGEMMQRVAHHVAQAETAPDRGRWEERFAAALKSLEFLPNSPTLMNAGTRLGLLSGCFVLPVEDSLQSIFTALGQMALIHQAGGGTGFDFSRLRPHGDVVASTHGVASGPVSFMGVFDAATEVIKQGGRRRGANMAVLAASHPDIDEFVAAKQTAGRLENFNLSVAVSDAFMRAVERDGTHRLVNPRTGRVSDTRPARALFQAVAAAAHRTGDPGLLFLDRINRDNPVPALGRIESTNPCGEVPLLPFESCNLGSVNLARMVAAGRPDWERLGATVRLAVRFLDDVIEVNRYPIPEVERATQTTRKIGVGVMGLAEFLAALGVPYDSEDALRLGRRIARLLRDQARRASVELAAERGAFPAFEYSALAAKGFPPLRNAQVTSIAPTGTISIIAGTTSGIEPLFAVAYVRNVLGSRLLELNGLFERTARERGFYSEGLVAEIARTGGVRHLNGVPEDLRRAFVTALEVAPEWHLRMQAAFQRSVDAAVAKTVNLPASATVDDVASLYLQAWRLGLKGITVYRYGSRPGQVLAFLADGQQGPSPLVQVGSEYAGGCAGHVCEV